MATLTPLLPELAEVAAKGLCAICESPLPKVVRRHGGRQRVTCSEECRRTYGTLYGVAWRAEVRGS